MNWLIKEEPTHYNFDDLVRDGRTSWSGVRNPVAQKNLQSMRKGDRIFYYHTGDVKAVVGTASAASAPYPDPADKTGKKLQAAVTLKAIKADKSFASFPLVRISRLSVMPVTDDEWKRIEAMAV